MPMCDVHLSSGVFDGTAERALIARVIRRAVALAARDGLSACRS